MAAAAALVSAIGVATAGQAEAGVEPTGNLLVNITVRGVDPVAVLDGLVIEVWNEDPLDTFTQVPPVTCDDPAPDVAGLPWRAQADYTCSFAPQETPFYAIGLAGVPEHYRVSGECIGEVIPSERLDLGGQENFVYTQVPAQCTLVVEAYILMVDKVVAGGDAASSDFTIDVVDDQGDPVVSIADVANATCQADFDPTKCGAVVVPPGTGFQIAEASVENYELTSVQCDEIVDVENPPSGAVEDIGEDGFSTGEVDTYCVVVNTYVPPPTTTTTTTTTVAPTTTIDAGVVTLPQTGTSASTNTAIAAVAALFVLLGGAMLAARRRTN